MSDEITSNPFAALFTSFEDVHHKKDSEIINSSSSLALDKSLSMGLCKKLEEVLVITVDRENTRSCSVFLEDLTFGKNVSTRLEYDCVNQALFERLMLEDVSESVVCKCGGKHGEDISETRPVFYLYQCYCRSKKFLVNLEECASVRKAISSQCAMYLSHPEMFPYTPDASQLIDLIQTYHSEPSQSQFLKEFITDVAKCILEDESSSNVSLFDVLQVPLDALRERVQKMSLVDSNLIIHLKIMQYFMLTPELSAALIKFCTPVDLQNARSYQDTLLGAFLSSSCLPKKSGNPYEFFGKPSQFSVHELNITEQNIWSQMQNLVHEIEACLYSLLKQSTETKDLLLNWIGNCLNANSSRTKIWNNQMANAFESLHCSDGFMLNLGSVLLRLCKPFSEPYSPKLLKIQTTYCTKKADRTARIPALTKETCLVPAEEGNVSSSTAYNFITESFYFCHYAIHLGFKTAHEHLTKLGQEMNRIQRIYDEATAQSGNQSSETIEHIQESMEKGMTKFLTLRTALKEPEMLNNMLMFNLASATWLINITITKNESDFAELSFPLNTEVPKNLQYTPEFIVENIKDCAQFMRQFSPDTLEISNEFLQHLLSLILVFMGSPERMNNPHLRANLAELLEALLPSKDYATVFSTDIYRKELLLSHPHIQQLVPTLLHVFVSIEMTGQSVTFEQRFPYRRPMYAIFDYIRTVDLHLERIKQLAVEAEANIEAAQPPLFLRFVNLLINDAVFLLDEVLSFMSKLKELQEKQENGEWQQLSTNQRLQNEGNLQHMGMLARFHNLMGNDTIHTLQWLTAEVQFLFCHPTLIDRITYMLNYFLSHLVGPKKKNLKVKDRNQYDFKPQELVENICRIYINLGSLNCKTSKEFCSAVSQDHRSYSPELFTQAENVLLKIGKPHLAEELKEIAVRVQQLSLEIQQDESALGDAPEDYLDPIMSTLMTDPVRLPSSGITVDRKTIARHLLSDQSDPFNRSPLTMDMVQPDHELKVKIHEWVKSQKS